MEREIKVCEKEREAIYKKGKYNQFRHIKENALKLKVSKMKDRHPSHGCIKKLL